MKINNQKIILKKTRKTGSSNLNYVIYLFTPRKVVKKEKNSKKYNKNEEQIEEKIMS